jgi:hypothetical protein
MRTLGFNINDEVWARLTEHGVRAHQRYYGVGGNGPDVGLRMLALRTVNGWTREQLWVLMAILGPHMRNGGPKMIEEQSIYFADPNAPAPSDGARFACDDCAVGRDCPEHDAPIWIAADQEVRRE